MFDPYTYRCPAGHPDPCPVCTGAPHLEEILQYEGPETVAAVFMETVTGTNGVIPPPDGYLQSIREVCDRHGILLVFDEVMAGFGRTGRWFACENWDVVPDIITVAKGINSGYVPARRDDLSEAHRRLGARQVLSRRADVRRSPAGLCVGGGVDRGVPGGRRGRERGRGRRVLGERLARAGRAPSVDRRGARPRLLLGRRARQEPRDARDARAVQRVRAKRPRRSLAWRRLRSSAAST